MTKTVATRPFLIYHFVGAGLRSELHLWNFQDGRSGEIGHVVTAARDSDGKRPSPDVLVHTEVTSNAHTPISLAMSAALMVPQAVLDSLSEVLGVLVTVTELAARAVRRETPWDRTSIEVDGVDRDFVQFGWGQGIVFVSADSAVRVSIFDSVPARSRRELVSTLVRDLPLKPAESYPHE
jgi:hypothetical protein